MSERSRSRETCKGADGLLRWNGSGRGGRETSPPQILASGRGRCRAAGSHARRMGASLSVAAGAHDRRLSGGSAPDIIARLIGQWLSDRLGQQFVIDNRPGAASNIAHRSGRAGGADGYTLQMTVLTNVFNTTLYTNLKFNFVSDIAHVAGVANAPYVMIVPPSFPAKTDSRVHRLRQGQSRQDQHGLGRQRDPRPIFSASCSRPWPASIWFTSPIAATTCPICSPGRCRSWSIRSRRRSS